MISFTPLIDEIISKYLEEKKEVKKIVNMFGSPCNIIFPQILEKNITSFTEVFKKHRLNGKIFYAHKTNKSNSIVKEASLFNIGLDVASYNELKSGLSNGFTGNRIEATGPKNEDFITLGLQHNIIFNIDNISELKQILKLKSKLSLNEKIKILFRISGFESAEIISKSSRFGIDTTEVYKCFEIINQNVESIDFLGFSFHLDTIMLKEKIVAINECLKLFDIAIEKGFSPRVLNIGGGYKVNYLEYKDEWNKSITNLKESFLNNDESLTWNNTSFGLTIKNGTLSGTMNIYNYYDEDTGSKYLDELLNIKLEEFQNRSVGEILSENMITLYVEPGKALVDQLGITLAKVSFVKKNKNDTLIGLDMKRTDVVIGDQELFIDPIIITEKECFDEKQGVYFIGNLCLETDLIFKHKVFIDVIPDIGDVVVFINTAGYFMDFNASDTIKQNVARKLVAIKNQHDFNYYLDEVYNPILDKE